MHSTTPQPTELLHYIPAHRVLICKKCRYAIQPNAMTRHLKDVHHIYHSGRQSLMSYTLGLDLADPKKVVPPEPHDAPAPFIPIQKGVACSVRDCDHLCVTIKRMKRHWAVVHKDMHTDGIKWHPVNLQTFFRGNRLRYFRVDVSSTPGSQPEPKSDKSGGKCIRRYSRPGKLISFAEGLGVVDLNTYYVTLK